MSSSDEDAVRRPGRSGASGRQSADNEQNGTPAAPDEAPASNMNGDEDEDADLFGSDEPDAEAGNDEYGIYFLSFAGSDADYSLGSRRAHWMMKNSTREMTWIGMTGLETAWTTRMLPTTSSARPLISWI